MVVIAKINHSFGLIVLIAGGVIFINLVDFKIFKYTYVLFIIMILDIFIYSHLSQKHWLKEVQCTCPGRHLLLVMN